MDDISDDELEFQVNDRLSFMEFLGLEDAVPDAKTVWSFRQKLADHALVEEIFTCFHEYLHERGYQVETGQIVDATLVSVRKQRNTRQQNQRIKQGETQQEWQENHHILRQKDRDARWIKKNNISYFGYKNHISVDVEYGFIRRYQVTDASVHDSQVLTQILDIDGTQVWGDSAYRSQRIEGLLKTLGFASQIHEKRYGNQPLSEQQKQQNREKSKVRARVEHRFGQWVMCLGYKFVRVMGQVRVATVIGLKNLTLNLLRYGFWERQKQMA